jgi:tripartite-type tricarboxylate transporter receptor subunit TctC
MRAGAFALTTSIAGLLLAACTVASPPAGGPTPASASKEAVDFAGKTIHLVVGYTAGGGFDANARVLAPHLQSALKGNPTIVVDNQPGADSLVAAKTVLTGPQRGEDISVVVFVSTLPVKSVLNNGIEGFSPEKEAAFIGMPDAAPTQIALCARKSVVASLDAFLARGQPIKVGGLTGGSYYDALLRWTKEAGFPIDIVFGYAATAPMILAFNQGEVDAIPACRDQDLQQNPDWIDQDQITPLFSFVALPDALKKAQASGKYPWLKNVLEAKPVSPDLKTVFETINAVNTGTNMYAVNKTISAPVLTALQAGFKQAVTSPAFVGDMQKRQLSVGYKSPEEIASTLQSLNSAPPTVRQLISKMLGG